MDVELISHYISSLFGSEPWNLIFFTELYLGAVFGTEVDAERQDFCAKTSVLRKQGNHGSSIPATFDVNQLVFKLTR